MAASNYHKHLTLAERQIIETSIKNGAMKSSIANILGKDKSTIGKEIKLHRVLTHKFNLPLECANYQRCKLGRSCKTDCSNYVKFICNRRDRSPGACNGCERFTHCRFDKYTYKANLAQKEYESDLVDSRVGANLTTSEAKFIADTVKPLLEKGQSPYHIITSHPELDITERTLYNYINGGTLSSFGVISLSLRSQVSRKISKNKDVPLKKRADNKHIKGRTYADFTAFVEANKDISIVEMDTVYNDNTNGPFIQTFKFLDFGFLIGVFHETKTAEDMVKGVDLLHEILGDELFCKYVPVLLTDRGSEFACAEQMEMKDGVRRTRVYYCDPMQSQQKPHLENIHNELRFILPNECDLRALGLTSQDKLNLAISHINSFSKEKLNGKSAIELMEFLNPELMNKFYQFGIDKIEKDEVVLKPHLLK